MSTETHLDRILAQTRTDLPLRRNPERDRRMESMAGSHQPRGFAASLRNAAVTRPAVIAELKKASPSKGLIRPVFHPAELAAQLELGGAACLSVLTDEPFFQGSLEYLQTASANTLLPCLRKDFIVDEFQILEARAYGADAILLIVAALTDAELKHLRGAARAMGLDVLCEVHDRAELDRALPLDCEMVGVNSRNLRTFEVNTAEAEKLAHLLPAEVIRVAESGIGSAADIRRMTAVGYNAFLVGETLMRAPNPGDALLALLQPEAEEIASASLTE
ncbi:indole-3-glycerol phosphate synthase TrpC [Terriglobus roseus]|uniref:Indole-3-glycerol phosphate synthase n=1 Tax=Terriglobus roseus TaxID=392734 RepID=A0A1H4LCX2_9BACT|nr:indole-3-glycerol phosphate synthase [Terriglobus roseus]